MRSNKTIPLFLVLAMLSACWGTAARNNVLLPALQQVWPNVRVQIEREAAAASVAVTPQLVKADVAFQAGDPVSLAAVDWLLLDGLVEADVVRRLASGELGLVPAGSIRERALRFTEARLSYLRMNK